jgi:hypothetical protein
MKAGICEFFLFLFLLHLLFLFTFYNDGSPLQNVRHSSLVQFLVENQAHLGF